MTRRKRSLQIVVMLALLGLALGAAGANTLAARPGADADVGPTLGSGRPGSPLVRTALKSDTSPALASLPARITQQRDKVEANENPFIYNQRGNATGLDPARQSARSPLVMPTPIANFDGMYNQNGPVPPDTDGAVGRTQYLQIVNSQLQVFSKTGTSLYGPTNINNLWQGFGGVCETYNNGDPIALYDGLASRWLVSQFNFVSQSDFTHECIAISTGPDATGSYYRYDFVTSPVAGAFEDYPHLGVWPDGYYMAANQFGPGNAFAGSVYAFDRAKMLVGDATATQVYFATPNEGGRLPSDLNGPAPPSGSPNYFMDPFNPAAGVINEYKFHADFTTPASSTFTGPFAIAVAPWNDVTCGAMRERCVPQPGTTAKLETTAGRFMHRLSYRNLGGIETLVVNHTVNAGPASPNGITGVRWYEFRNPNSVTPTVFQQGTYAPTDGLFRWMGSAQMDRSGDIALGFSSSSTTSFPDLRYAGRLGTDPLGMLSQGEAVLFAGTGSEDFPAAPRWGDYSDLSVDPSDECTFWYTNEYFSVTGLRDWRTRIGSFKFPSCVPLLTVTPTPTTTAPPTFTTTPSATTTQCVGATNVTDSITTAAPTQTGRLGLGSPVSTCAAPKAVSAVSDTFVRHYKSYTYTNSSGSSQCVTVSLTQACGNNAVQSATYLGSYDPANIQNNYLADGGAAGASSSYSFNLATGQTAVVVVAEVSPNLGCATYTLSINPCGALPTATTTGTPTSGPSVTPTLSTTPTATATVVCQGVTYQPITTAAATLVPATNDTGNHCDDCATSLTFPFPVTFYGTPYASANVSSNGNLQFTSNNPNVFGPPAPCLPITANTGGAFGPTIFPYFDDFLTDAMTMTHGIYTATTGVAPTRQFVVRWQTTYFNHTGDANFEILFNETLPTISIIYGANANNGAEASSGVQLNFGQYTAYSCNTAVLAAGTRVDYVPVSCNGTGTPTAGPPSATVTTTSTVANTTVPTTTRTSVPSATSTTQATTTQTQTAVGSTATPTVTPTSILPTVTLTVVLPSVTLTVLPPSATLTVLPPSATLTVVPPSVTLTAVPPSATATQTVVANTATSTATQTPPANTATVTATATACPGAIQTFSGSIGPTDPSHTSVVSATGAPSSCAAPHGYPGTFGTAPYNYDTYTVTNTSSSPQCITVLVNGGGCGSTSDGVQVNLYQGSFDPSNLAAHYLGDSGSDGVIGLRTLSVTVPGNTALVIVVDEYTNTRGCASYTLTVSGLPCATGTATATSVATTPTATGTPAATATPCTIRFTDVTDPTAYYYTGVYYLACRGVISGYSDGTYKPFNNTTRGQMTKIVTLAFNIPLVTPPPAANRTFTDVTPDNVFYQLIETAAARQIVSGYSCGGVNSQTGAAEPCDSARRPYFRPSNFVTRAQLTKIVVIGAGFTLINPPTPTFSDVARADVFYPLIETAVCHGIISGYSDGTFRPNNYAFRGQIAKIVYLAATNPRGNCSAGTATR
ncbi:MAG: S-layer homology domain-containing protein [Chloroflexota bacterium]|nr:S-layer homology domain-containing protein [Chloroflexota bacterium]